MSSIDIGKTFLKEKSIIVCGIIRNGEIGLKKNIPVIDKLCDMVKRYHVVMFENDSVDKTKQILHQWSQNRSFVHVKTEDFHTQTIPSSESTRVNRFFSYSRISKMANYRNKYLEYIAEHQLKADYVIVVDMDVRRIELDGILDSFACSEQWDVVTSNGYIYSPSAFFRKRYNDTYALVECGKEKVPQTEESIAVNQYKWAFLKRGMPLMAVYSAFGGMAIYKYEAICQCKYEVLSNADSRVEVRCEHFALCEQMHKNGYGRIFINPNMTIRYRPYMYDRIYKILHR